MKQANINDLQGPLDAPMRAGLEPVATRIWYLSTTEHPQLNHSLSCQHSLPDFLLIFRYDRCTWSCDLRRNLFLDQQLVLFFSAIGCCGIFLILNYFTCRRSRADWWLCKHTLTPSAKRWPVVTNELLY